MLKNWLLYFLIPFPFFTTAQTPSISFHNISINDGLSQSSVVDIVTDTRGFVWMATQDGLNRYDGKEFIITRKNFDDITTSTGCRLGKIVSGSNNILWLLTSGGRLEKLDLITETITPVTHIGKDSIQLPPITCFIEDSDHNWWIGTGQEGLFYFITGTGEVKHFTHHSALALPGNTVNAIFEDSKKQRWILTDKGLIMIAGQHFLPQQFIDNRNDTAIACSMMDEDQQGNYWAGTYGKGLFLKKKNDSIFRSFKTPDKKDNLPADLVVLAVKTDHQGNTWAGTYGNGLFLIHQSTGVVEHFITNDKDPFSLAYNDVLCIKEDKYGGIWIGTDGGGVNYYDKRFNNFKTLSKNNTPEKISIEQVRSITTDTAGGIWIGTSNSGLTYANLQQNILFTRHFLPFTKGTSNYDRVVSLLTDKEQDLWVGTQGNGLLILNSQTGSIKKWFHPQSPARPLPDNTIWCMLADSGLHVWMGTRSAGFCLFDKEKGVLLHFDTASPGKSRLPENNVRCITRINDSMLCIGFEQKGIRLFNSRSGELLAGSGSINKPGQTVNLLKCIYYQYPYLWIGTLGNGLAAYHLVTRKFTWITEKEGLPNNSIYGIVPANDGTVWISSNRGLIHFVIPEEPDLVKPDNFTSFIDEEGLQSNEFNTGAYHRSANGILFFGGTNGLTYFNPRAFAPANLPVTVSITHIMVNNQPLETDTAVAYKNSLSLTYNRNSLSFSFAALDFVSPGRFHYYYQLLQYDKVWIDAGNRNYAAYTNLPPGHYIFRIKASRRPDTPDPVTILDITIRPPYWQTWWFILLCILLLAGLLYAFYRSRIRALLHLQQVRNRIASDLHDDIGSTLTNINMLSELSRKTLPEKNENAHVFLNRISEEVNRSGQALDDIVWSINTNNDTLEQTVVRMRRYAAEIFDAANISYALQLDEQFAQRKLNMEQRRDIFLIFKEAINNVYKHAGAKNVFIEVRPERNRLYMKIKDDGKGFNATAFTHRNGLKNMNERLEKWKGQMIIEASPGHGCSIHIDITIA